MNPGKWFLLFLIFCLCPVAVQAGQELTPQQVLLQELGVTKAVIFNGDDIGRTEWSNEGIVEAFEQGLLTSTSLMTPALFRDQAYDIIASNPQLDVGVHLVLARDDMPGNVYGPLTPADQVPSLVDDQGHFFTSIAPLGKANKNEVYKELTAQIEHALAHGVDVTHLDCHMGWYHDYNPKTLKPVLALAAKYELPIRWQGSSSDPMLVKKGIVVPDHLDAINGRQPFEDKKQHLIDALNDLKPGITEFVIHPASGGYDEGEQHMRTTDLALMLDPDVRAAIENNGIALIGYRHLRDIQRRINAKRENEK